MTSEARNAGGESEAHRLLAAELTRRPLEDFPAIHAIQIVLAQRDEAYRTGGEAMRKATMKTMRDIAEGCNRGHEAVSKIMECRRAVLALPPVQREGEK
jgi:hypothetical protein